MKRLFAFCVASVLAVGCSSENTKEATAEAPRVSPAAPAAAQPAQSAQPAVQPAQPMAAVEPAKPKYFEERKQTATATVTAINQATRQVTLKGFGTSTGGRAGSSKGQARPRQVTGDV